MVRAGLLGLALAGSAVALAADKVRDPDALWRIVSTRCNAQALTRPADCVAVWADPARNSAVLKDHHGDFQYLLLPLRRVTGIEDPQLLRPGTPNYFGVAWQARGFVERALGRPLPRRYMSLALNSPHGRSQEQLHVHLDCLRADVAEVLARQAPVIGEHFAPLPEPLRGHAYLARYLPGETLTADPVHLLAQALPPGDGVGHYSLVVAGAEDRRGPGFVVLATRLDEVAANFASGEELQDHACGAVTGAKALDGVL
ncbi:MAG: CDP-diacylglycerol diphosphatase [Pseudomonas sp.]